MTHRPLFAIAAEIEADWTARRGTAAPYLAAMSDLVGPADRYGAQTGADMVRGFLVNAQTWHGEVARRVKQELTAILQDHEEPYGSSRTP